MKCAHGLKSGLIQLDLKITQQAGHGPRSSTIRSHNQAIQKLRAESITTPVGADSVRASLPRKMLIGSAETLATGMEQMKMFLECVTVLALLPLTTGVTETS